MKGRTVAAPGACAVVIGLLCAAVTACARDPRPAATLDIATTTSVVNSGLLTVVTERFLADSGITIRAHAAGSGRALEMLSDGVVDLVISHAPAAEAKMLESHPRWQYRKIAVNHFLVVGPPADPAGVGRSASAADAFERIAKRGANFVSRGDNSGTHEKELELWKAASISPHRERLLISGSGMGTTLRQASEQRAYTLTDDATFHQLREQLTLQALFSGDPRLVNSYAVIADRDSAPAVTFAAWLTGGGGRKVIADYAAGGTHPFQVWPADCPGATPSAPLCSGK
jgi:tungstate transport system substrate-binding protein